jgi:hypothetical protein
VGRSWRNAASVPNAIDSGTITISEATASTSELNNRFGRTVEIGTWRLCELPQSPVTKPVIQRR